MTQLLLLLMMFQSTPTVRGQYVADYKKVMEVFKSPSGVSYSTRYKSFDSNAQRPDTIMQGKYICKSNNFYAQTGSIETYMNSKYLLTIENSQRIMFLKYSKNIKIDVTPYKMIDSIILKYKCEISMTDIDNGNTRRYTVEYPTPGDNNVKGKMIMEFNKKTYLISRLVVYMPPNEDLYHTGTVNTSFRPFVELNYMDYSFNPVSDEVFSTEKFVIVDGKEAKLRDPYKKYQLISSLFLNPANR